MGRMDGKVAFITGAARGQGRAHAIRLAEEGADIVGVDVCESIPTIDYPGPSASDLEETAKMVGELGRRCVTAVADVRDAGALSGVLAGALRELGRLDTVVANAGVMSHPTRFWKMSDEQWHTTLDINLTGVWNTVRAAAPILIEQGEGGSMILTSSTAGSKGAPNLADYSVAKHGVIGLMKVAAQELGRHRVRVNCVLPTAVDTQMIQYQELYDRFRPDLDSPTRADCDPIFAAMHVLPMRYLEPEEIANAVLWLASDESRFVTGVELRVDAGFMLK